MAQQRAARTADTERESRLTRVAREVSIAEQLLDQAAGNHRGDHRIRVEDEDLELAKRIGFHQRGIQLVGKL